MTVTITGIAKASDTVIGVQVYPNPNKGRFVVSYTVAKPDKVKIILLNGIGQILFENTQNKASGTHEQRIELNNLPTGVYFLQIHTNGKVLNQKVIVKH